MELTNSEEIKQDVPFPPKMLEAKQLDPDARKLLQQQWNRFNIIKNSSLENFLDNQENRDNPTLPKGTLLHGTSYTPEVIESIKNIGIISGEMVGIPEDSETHYCADFFKVPDNMTIQEYYNYCGESIKRGMLTWPRSEARYLPNRRHKNKQLGIIIDTTNPKLQELLQYDAYSSNSKALDNIVNYLAVDKERENIAAVLCGIPSSFINGFITTDALEQKDIDHIKDIFGENIPIFSKEGSRH